MNIIIFTSSSNCSGGSRQALYLAQGLHERGHSVTLFHPPTSSLRRLAPDFPCFASLGEKKYWRKNIEAAFPQDGSGCIVHAFHNAAVKKAAWWGLFWREKAVVVAHRGVIFRPNNPLPYWSPGIARFLVNSQKCQKVLQSIGVKPDRLIVVPNAVPDSRITPLHPPDAIRSEHGWTEKQFCFGTIANDSPVKGVKELLQAFAAVYKVYPEKARLMVIGVTVENWLPLCEELGITEAVHLLDHIEDVASYLHAMDAFVLASRSESMPNTLLEALRCGKPSIGTDVGAVKEVIGSSGIIVPPDNCQALADAMLDFLKHPELVALCADNVRHQARGFIPSIRLTHVQYIYRTLLTQKGFSIS